MGFAQRVLQKRGTGGGCDSQTDILWGCSFLPPLFLWGGLLDVLFTQPPSWVLPGGGPAGGACATASEGWVRRWGGSLPQVKRKQQVLSTGSGLVLLAPDQGPPHSDLTPDDLRWSSCNNHGNKVHNECNAPQTIPPFSQKPSSTGPRCQTAWDATRLPCWGLTGPAGSTLCRRSSWRRCGPVSSPLLPPPAPARGLAPHPKLHSRALWRPVPVRPSAERLWSAPRRCGSRRGVQGRGLPAAVPVGRPRPGRPPFCPRLS